MDCRKHTPVILALLVITCNSCSDKPTTKPDGRATAEAAEKMPLGGLHSISFPISCRPETQAAFTRGLFLLHNMMYKQAEAVFDSATTADDECAMLYWGLAMTQFHPKWAGGPSDHALERGTDFVEQARSIAARNTGTSEREKGYIEAVDAYYKDWQYSDRNTRRERWRDAQEELLRKYPDDEEAKIFFGLAQLTTLAPNNFEGQRRVAGQLEKILKERPEHPGILHYLLHAYDNPEYAHRGVEAAETYENVAPDAPHALHMPSHIYVRLGDWRQVIAWNIRSRNAAEDQPVEDGRVSRHYLHAHDYLVYAYLQLADDAKVKQEAARINNETRWQLNSGPGAYALAAIPARIAVEQRAWAEAARLKSRAVHYTWDEYPWAEAITHAARGLGAARNGELVVAQQAIDELDRLKLLIRSPWWKGRVEVQRDVIAGWIAYKQGQIDEAVELLTQAAERELAAGKQSVEPGHAIYAVEQLGELFLELERPKEALEVFKRSLEDSPRRFYSLYGAGRAAEMDGIDEKAAAYYAALIEMVVAENERPETGHAHDFLTRTKSR